MHVKYNTIYLQFIPKMQIKLKRDWNCLVWIQKIGMIIYLISISIYFNTKYLNVYTNWNMRLPQISLIIFKWRFSNHKCYLHISSKRCLLKGRNATKMQRKRLFALNLLLLTLSFDLSNKFSERRRMKMNDKHDVHYWNTISFGGKDILNIPSCLP